MRFTPVLLAALFIAAGSAALAQTNVTTTVTSSNTMTVNTTGVTLTPLVGVPDQDATTTIDYSTNDGTVHTISVATGISGWDFVPEVATNTTPEYPALRFVSASSTGGGTSGAAATLIMTDNTPGGTDVFTGITNTSGVVTVTLEASITQAVTAGTYSTTLTYTFN